jgi:hypothetical protein
MSYQSVPIPNDLTELENDFYKETVRKKKLSNGKRIKILGPDMISYRMKK